jgi:hypothetical protein
VKQLRPSGPLVVLLDDPIGISPLRRGSVRVYRHYAVGVIDCSNIVLIVYVVKLRSLSNCELVTRALMVLRTSSSLDCFVVRAGPLQGVQTSSTYLQERLGGSLCLLCSNATLPQNQSVTFD